jgi:hypothetical protein
MKAAAWIVSLAIVIGGMGCKKGNEDLKKKVTAIRDKALSCTDAKCASAASEEYISLTKDLSGLSDEDAKFFGDVGAEIRMMELKLESVH